MDEHDEVLDDSWLRDQFAPQELPDDGFSQGVLSRIGQRAWLRWLLMLAACSIGAFFALSPALHLLLNFQASLPLFSGHGADWLLGNPTMTVAAMMAMASVGLVSLIEG